MVIGLKECGYPIKPISGESGYFMMADISEMRSLIPQKYLENSEYEDDPNTMIVKN